MRLKPLLWKQQKRQKLNKVSAETKTLKAIFIIKVAFFMQINRRWSK